jgi:hypothetical protein
MATKKSSARPVGQSAGVTDSGANGTERESEARRPNPEVVARAKRRSFTLEYKTGILAETDAAKGSGEIGAVLRREGLYSSHLTKWRQERRDGMLEGLTPRRRGPKVKINPVTVGNRKLKRENERLAEHLRKAQIVIDVQKKVAMLLGYPVPAEQQQ